MQIHFVPTISHSYQCKKYQTIEYILCHCLDIAIKEKWTSLADPLHFQWTIIARAFGKESQCIQHLHKAVLRRVVSLWEPIVDIAVISGLFFMNHTVRYIFCQGRRYWHGVHILYMYVGIREVMLPRLAQCAVPLLCREGTSNASHNLTCSIDGEDRIWATLLHILRTYASLLWMHMWLPNVYRSYWHMCE